MRQSPAENLRCRTQGPEGGFAVERLSEEGRVRGRRVLLPHSEEDILCSARPSPEHSHWGEARKYPPQAGADMGQHLAHILGRRHLHGDAVLLSFQHHLQEPGRYRLVIGTAPWIFG